MVLTWFNFWPFLPIIIIIIIMAVKRKDASLNKILTRRNRVACHYHSLK